MVRPQRRERLRNLIRERGFSLRDLATLLGRDPGTLSRWLNSIHEKVPADVVPSLAVVLGVPLPTVLEALYPVEDTLERHDLAPSIGKALREEAASAGSGEWLEDVTEAVHILDSLSPSDAQRRRRFRRLSSVYGASSDVQELLNVYIHHSLDHYLIRLLKELGEKDPERAQEFFRNLARLLVSVRPVDLSHEAFPYRILQNAFSYLIAHGPRGAQSDVLREAERMWQREPHSEGALYVARESCYAAGFSGQPSALPFVEKFLVYTLSERPRASRIARRVMAGCEALAYAPSLRRELGPYTLVPDVGRLSSPIASVVLEGTLDHLQRELPEAFRSNYAAIFLVWAEERGLKMRQDLLENPRLAEKMARFVRQQDPVFPDRALQLMWNAAKTRVSEYVKSIGGGGEEFSEPTTV